MSKDIIILATIGNIFHVMLVLYFSWEYINLQSKTDETRNAFSTEFKKIFRDMHLKNKEFEESINRQLKDIIKIADNINTGLQYDNSQGRGRSR